MSTSHQLTQFWIEFLELYKSLPQLWKVSHEGYAHKLSRASAYERLLEKYQEFDDGAKMDHLKKKIANMRTSYRRETKKVEEDSSYTPMLWYYPHMEFLNGQDEDASEGEKLSRRTVNKEEIEMKRLPTPPRKRKRLYVHASQKNGLKLPSPLPSNSQHHSSSQPIPIPARTIAKTEDEAQALSATWEVLYRKLDSQQKLYANRVITEVLYLGALRKLKVNSCKVFDNLAINARNPISITTDASDELCNVNEALRSVKQLENFAMREENQETLDLLIQLEEMLKNSTDDHQQLEGREDDKDYEPQENYYEAEVY